MYDVFQMFHIFFRIFHVSTVCNVIYHPFFTRKTPISEKNSFMTPFLLCLCFRAHPTNTTSQNTEILGNGCMDRSQPQILGGSSPQSLYRSPPMLFRILYASLLLQKLIFRVHNPLQEFLCEIRSFE